jgi:hypothetical protein
MITRTCIILVILLGNIINGYAQGTLRGKVTDENGEPVIGGLVVLKNNKLIASSTDLDGNYSIKLPDSIPQTLVVSYIGYQTIEEIISIKKGEVLIKNFDLKSTSKEIKELVVEGRANRAKDNYMEKMKINSATSIDFVSSETIKKTGDATASAAITRVSGVSSNGSFITVRGIGDRYVKTQINGLVIPTLDPLTNNIKLDLFPSSLLDNIFITKTASADLPGDFSGALISLETKDFPDQFMVNVESTVGYNSQSTFKDYLSSERSSTEWLGYDNDLRDIDHLTYRPVIEEPTVYQQLVVLGLEDFYNAIGVNKDTPWSDDYFKLGLVELGLLDKGKFNDIDAVNDAKNTFNKDNINRNNAYRAINAKASEFGKSLPNNWDTKYRVAPLNFSQSFSIGNQVNFLNRPLGIIGGFRYSSAVQYDSNATIRRLLPGDLNGPQNFTTDAIQRSTKETNGISGLLQITYKLHPNHTIGVLFMPNFLGINNIRSFLDSANGTNNLVVKDQFYEQRKQLVYQAKSQHYFPIIKSKLNFNISYTNAKSVAPDFKVLAYALLPKNQNAIGGGFPIRRFYRYLNEDLLDANIKAEIPLFEKPDLARKLKLGGSFFNSRRDSRQYEYFYSSGPYAALGFENQDLQSFFDLSEYELSEQTNSVGLPEATINKSYLVVDLDSYHTIGRTNIYSGFALVDFTIIPRLRVSTGARLEYTDIYADVFNSDSMGYAALDERRFQPGDAFMVNPGVINQANILPSINIIYKLRNKETSPINLRVNYSKTIARPSVRELTETTIFDYEYRNFIFGNADLKTVDINNYDFRVESYFENGDNISLSVFYKKFINHIELVQTTQGFSWQNANESNVKGVEIDARKIIVKGLEVRANFTLAQSLTEVIQNNIYVKNNIKVLEPYDTLTRQMSGQAPYVINGIISYTMDSLRLTTSIAYNVQGPRLAVVSAEPKLIPDVFELPRHVLDFRIAKQIGKRFTVTVTVKDILNSPIRRSYKLPSGFTADFDNFRYGTNYNLSISFKI